MTASAFILSSNFKLAFFSVPSPSRLACATKHVRVVHNLKLNPKQSPFRPWGQLFTLASGRSSTEWGRPIFPIPSVARSLSSLSTAPPIRSSDSDPALTQRPRDGIDSLREQYQNLSHDSTAARANALCELVKQSFPFKLDDFQIQALSALTSDSSVVLSAPTGAGKTVIGEMAIYLALCLEKRVFYTTPLKALSNQKFYDFKRLFGAHRVGLLTGDITVNRDADIVVMTTEIYRNMLYADAMQHTEAISPTKRLFAVVFDEFHYLNDRDRGTVWEECVINSPPHILLVALSATISNSNDVRHWFSNVQGPTELVQSDVRPVPLKFGFCNDDGLIPLFAERGKRIENRARKGFDRRTPRKQKKEEKEEAKMHPKLLRYIQARKNDARTSRPHRNDDGHPLDDKAIMKERYQKIVARNSRRGGFAEIPSFPYVVRLLRRRDMLPCIFFIFSRAGCDRAASSAAMERESLVSPKEEGKIRQKLGTFVTENPDMVHQDRVDLALKGIASHHAGLLPLWKLCVEELFQDGLIKVVFATETLAAGINMPARTTVISSLSKRAGEEGFRPLTTSEVLQMAGRAGRRGMDVVGYSLILKSKKEGALEAFKVLTKTVDALESHFTPTYGMVLNLLLSRSLGDAKRLVDRSFGNFLRQNKLKDQNEISSGAPSSETSMETLRMEKVALISVLQDARDILERVDRNELQSFVKCLERVKAEKRALAYLIQQIGELDLSVIEDTLTFAPAGTRLLLREKIKPSSGAERRQRRRGLKEALQAAGEGDFGAELRMFYLSGDDSDLQEVEEEVDETVIEAALLDMHVEHVNMSPIFAAVDAHGQLRMFSSAAVSHILYDEEAVDVDGLAEDWNECTLPSRSLWRSISDDQFVAPLPDCLTSVVTAVQEWRARRIGAMTDGEDLFEHKNKDKTSPDLEAQRIRVEDGKRIAREHVLYKRKDASQLLAAKRAVPNIESILDGSSNPISGKNKRKRSRGRHGRYTSLDNERTIEFSGVAEDGVENSSWDEFMSLVRVLQHYGFVDDQYGVTSTGEMGAKVRAENELWTSIVLMEPDLGLVSPIHLGAIIGATLMEGGGRGDSFVDWETSEETRQQIEQLIPARTRMLAVQTEFGADVSIGLEGELMGLVEMWASGVAWAELLRATSLQEGDVCRILRRTLDVLRQIPHLPVASAMLKRNARRAISLLDRFPVTDDRTYWVAESERV